MTSAVVFSLFLAAIVVFGAAIESVSAQQQKTTSDACGKPLKTIPLKAEQGGKVCIIPWTPNDCDSEHEVCIQKCKTTQHVCNAGSCRGYPAARTELYKSADGVTVASNVAYFSNTTGASAGGSVAKIVGFDPLGTSGSAAIIASCPAQGRAFGIELKVKFERAEDDSGEAPPMKFFADSYEKVLAHVLESWDEHCKGISKGLRRISKHETKKFLEDWCSVIPGIPSTSGVPTCLLKY